MDVPTSLLIISNCRLGDSLVMIPALRLLRQSYPDATITLASETPGAGFVGAADILGDRGLVDAFVAMPNPPGRLARLRARLEFFRTQRRLRHDLGIVLFPPVPPLTMALVRRLTLYLQLCGIPRRSIVAPTHILPMTREPDGSLTRLPSVVDTTLRVLEPLGLPLPSYGEANALLPPLLTPRPEPALPTARPLLAVAPNANMPCNVWPVERFAAVLDGLPELTPVYFGGEACRPLCEQLHRRRPGRLVIGQPLSDVAAIMRHCCGYLGNDTGLMHLAAALNLPCVAIFSGRQSPGLWEPYVARRAVLRTPHLDCEGCQSFACPCPGHPCLDAISVAQVLRASRALLCEHD